MSVGVMAAGEKDSAVEPSNHLHEVDQVRAVVADGQLSCTLAAPGLGGSWLTDSGVS